MGRIAFSESWVYDGYKGQLGAGRPPARLSFPKRERAVNTQGAQDYIASAKRESWCFDQPKVDYQRKLSQFFFGITGLFLLLY